MSPQNLAAQELVSEPTEQKQRTNVYTIMLVVAFLCITVACVILYLELKEYGAYPWWKTGGIAPPTAMAPLEIPSQVRLG